MASAGTVTLELDANSVKLLRELQKTQKQTKSSATSMQRSMGDALDKIRGGINTTVKSLALLATGAAAAAAAIYKSTASNIDQLTKTSDKLGIATEDLQALRFAAEQTGVANNTLDMALQRMTRRVAEAAQGLGEAKSALYELNLDAAQLSKLSPDEQFRRIADAMDGVTTQGDRVRLAMRLFDSEGVALVNTLRGGRTQLDAFAQQARNLGLNLSRVDAAQVEAANDAMNRVRTTLTGISQQVTVQLAPVVSELANAFVEAGEAAGGMSNYINDGLRAIAKGFAWVGNIIHGWNLIIAGLRVVFGESFAFIMRALRTVGAIFEFVITAGRAGWSALIELMLKGVRAAIQGVEDFANGAINRINTLIGLVNHIPGVDIDLIGQAAFDSIESLNNAIKVASGTANKFKGDLMGMANQPFDNGNVNEFFNGFLNHVDATVEYYKDQFLTMAAGRIPTDEVDAFFDNIKQKSQEAGAVVAASMSGQGVSVKPTDEEGEGGYWQKWLASAENALTSADEMAKNTIETFTTGFGQAFESMIFDSENFGDAMRNLFVNMGRVVVRTLGQMAAEWLAYQLVQMVVGKTTKAAAASGMGAIAQAQSLQAGLNAFASTAAIPIVGPAVAPAAMGAALAVTQPIAASISALSLAGMAHDGIDSVPREGTWLLDKGERVYTENQAAKIDQMSMAIQRMSEKPTSIGFTFERNSDEDVRDALRRNSSLITSMVRKALYDEGKRI